MAEDIGEEGVRTMSWAFDGGGSGVERRGRLIGGKMKVLLEMTDSDTGMD